MGNFSASDTIFAPATPEGVSAVAVMRLSGPAAFDITEKIFKPKGSRPLKSGTFPKVIYGEIRDGEEVLDEALVLAFRGPRSYTGEDVVEFQCHGSPYVMRRLGQILLEKGARTAEPGEFTRRAFFHGRLSLDQAEAVMDLIAAETQAQQRMAMYQMRGGYAAQLRSLRQELVDLMALVELELDFSEEDVEFASRSKLERLLEDLMALAEKLRRSFASGQALRQGVPVAIVGAPNAGKSTLLNALLQDDRALVSDVAGTTRDTVTDHLYIGGVKFQLVDTAGLRDTSDHIEAMGIERSFKALEQARIILWVFAPDALLSADLSEKIRKTAAVTQATVLRVWNKSDVTPPPDSNHFLAVSARLGKGVDGVREALIQAVGVATSALAETLANQRHYEALGLALEAAARAQNALKENWSGELLAFELREVARHVGAITGEVVTDEVLGAIFSRFCIGK